MKIKTRLMGYSQRHGRNSHDQWLHPNQNKTKAIMRKCLVVGKPLEMPWKGLGKGLQDQKIVSFYGFLLLCNLADCKRLSSRSSPQSDGFAVRLIKQTLYILQKTS